LNLDNLTLKVKGVNGALVNSGGAIPSGSAPTFLTDFITDEFDRITGHGGTQTLPSLFPFNFQAPHKAHSLEDLIEVTLNGWNGNDDHIYLAHSKGDELVKATFAAKVVKL
jgi:hypothetical protein